MAWCSTMLWALGGTRFLGQLGTYLPRLLSASHFRSVDWLSKIRFLHLSASFCIFLHLSASFCTVARPWTWIQIYPDAKNDPSVPSIQNVSSVQCDVVPCTAVQCHVVTRSAMIQWCNVKEWILWKDMMRYKLHQVTGFYDFYVCRSIRAKRIRTASCRYAKICQVTRRLPKILDEFQKKRPWEHVDAAHSPPQEFGTVCMSKSGPLHKGIPVLDLPATSSTLPGSHSQMIHLYPFVSNNMLSWCH